MLQLRLEKNQSHQPKEKPLIAYTDQSTDIIRESEKFQSHETYKRKQG